MKWIVWTLLVWLCIGSITVQKGVGFDCDTTLYVSNNTFSFVNISLNGNRLDVGDDSLLIYALGGNSSIVYFTTISNSSFLFYEVPSSSSSMYHNISLAVNDSVQYSVYKNGVVKATVTPSSRIITYSTSAFLTPANWEFVLAHINCVNVRYGMYNGSTYLFGENQTFKFNCLPEQNGCVPRYETASRFLSNWTNSLGSIKSVYMSLNETKRGYTIYANDEFDNDSAMNITSTSTSVRVSIVDDEEEAQFWYWVSTYYPYQSYKAFVRMEACES